MKHSLTKVLMTVVSVALAFALSLNGAGAAPRDPASAKAKADMKLSSIEKIDLNSASQADLSIGVEN